MAEATDMSVSDSSVDEIVETHSTDVMYTVKFGGSFM